MIKFLSRALIVVLLVSLKTPSKADSIPEIVAKAKPAIVEIVTRDATGAPKALGTGFFVSSNGLVVTNQHVIEGADSITAVGNNGAIFRFKSVLAQPAGVDLVVLEFHATDVPFLKLGKSTTAVEGQKVIVIGNPTGLMGTVSDGIISAFRENHSLIQITAPISHGSSGSPVMDETGQVIGIATLLFAEGQNLNFAIPVEKLPEYIVQLLATLTQDEASLYNYRGFIDAHEGKFAKAISDFNEAIQLDPNYAAPYYNRGNAYYDQHEFAKAISDYNEAIRLDPKYAAAYYNRGIVYSRQGKLDSAIDDFTEAIRLDPDALAYYNRGFASGKRGDLDKAISDYTQAIRLQPNFALAYKGRGLAYLRAGERDKADTDFATAERLEAGQ